MSFRQDLECPDEQRPTVSILLQVGVVKTCGTGMFASICICWSRFLTFSGSSWTVQQTIDHGPGFRPQIARSRLYDLPRATPRRLVDEHDRW